jgi:hypothetical protein
LRVKYKKKEDSERKLNSTPTVKRTDAWEVCDWNATHDSGLLSHALHFGHGALVLAGSFAGLELASTCLTLPLTHGKLGHFRSFMIPFTLSSTAPFPCKMPLLLLGIIGLLATLLEIEEGTRAIPIKKLQNKHKHHLFHHVYRVRHKHNSALDQVRMEWGSKLHPRNVSILCLLGRDGIGQEVGPGEEPTTMEGVEDVEDRKVDNPRMRLLARNPSLHSRLVKATGSVRGADIKWMACREQGRDVLCREHGGKRSRRMMDLPFPTTSW